jgi:16S rRNA (adenine1518-N6/adenine1519-N6)-dimethyltransferase
MVSKPRRRPDPRWLREPARFVPERLRPRKSLGQNFLRDPNIARRIVRAIDPRPSDVMLEIGPGEGALTKYLAPKVGRLIVVDVDQRVVERMETLFPETEIVHDDFLHVDLDSVAQDHGVALRVVGNIPYNITSPILFHILDHRSSVADATLMVQKEVARRLAAGPGTKDYGILSVFFQLFTAVDILFDVSCHAFYPEPDVTSSVIRLRSLRTPRHELADEEIFRSMVRSVFGKRRKMLRGSMKYFCTEYGYRLPEEHDLTRRPEDLSVEEFVRMSNSLVDAGEQE